MFGEHTGAEQGSLPLAAAELLQQPREDGGNCAFGPERRSIVGGIHMRLLDLVSGCYVTLRIFKIKLVEPSGACT